MMAPLISRLANLSFSEAVFQSLLKCGRLTPLLTGQVGHIEFQTSDESANGHIVQADGKACSSMTASSYHVSMEFQ